MQSAVSYARVLAENPSGPDVEVGMVDRIELEISFAGDLSPEQKERLLQIAGRCPVHRMLTSSVQVCTRLMSESLPTPASLPLSGQTRANPPAVRPATARHAASSKLRPSGIGNWRTQCIVDLEGAAAITETHQTQGVILRQVRTGDPNELPRSDAGENEISSGKLRNFMVDFKRLAQIFEITSERIVRA